MPCASPNLQIFNKIYIKFPYFSPSVDAVEDEVRLEFAFVAEAVQ